MFLAQRPSAAAIQRFLDASRDLPLSYGPVGMVRGTPAKGRLDEQVVAIGHGDSDLRRARAALTAWKQFDLGWVEVFPKSAPTEVGTVVAVMARQFGLWSLNGCRIVYLADSSEGEGHFGFANGTLTNHAESGEELFEVFIDPGSGDVMYRIRVVSWPQAMLARLGHPLARLLQSRFRKDSAAAMRRAIVSDKQQS
jgi:uncharacterized protein (UPF0548 family)